METRDTAFSKVTTKQKKKGVALLLCILTGIFGGHKFYEGKFVMGIIYLCTAGLFGVGVIIDLIKLLKQPSVYDVDNKSFSIQNTADTFINLRYDLIGKILCGVAGVLLGFVIGGGTPDKGTDTILLVVGIVLCALGFGLNWLYEKDIMSTLISCGAVTVLAALALFAFVLLIALVVVYVGLKLVLGIDLLEFFSDLFGDDKKEKQAVTEQEDMDAPLSSLSIPDTITGPYGKTYRRVSVGSFSSEFYCDSDGSSVTIHDSDMGASLAGFYADTDEGHFTW